ncbi:hypothetical protein [Streptomyces sp. NPDC087300]|uniref:hypothetical protein n=1 Tax=Streptomyces sp. NPDC087300 TaxID=3365780 RepID=UPI00381457E0
MPTFPAAPIPGSNRTAPWVRADRDRFIHPNLPSSRGRDELVAAASAQLGTLECFHLWESMSNDKAIELAVRLTDLAPAGLDGACASARPPPRSSRADS